LSVIEPTLFVPVCVRFAVVPSVTVPVKVGLIANTVEPVPVVEVVPVKSASHEAAVVPDVKIQVHKNVFPAGIVTTVFSPDDWTVSAPVLLLWIMNASPRTNVVVTGSTTVCVNVPVKNCVCELAAVRVVVPPAVAVVA
jgi:hypothetical protein